MDATPVLPEPELRDLLGLSLGELDDLFVETRRQAAWFELRSGQILMAMVARVQEKPSEGFAEVGSSTFSRFLDSRGVSPGHGARLLSAARACEASAEVKQRFLANRISLTKAALLHGVLSKPELQFPGDDWVGNATTNSTHAFCEAVFRRKEEVRLKEPPVRRTLHLSRTAAADLERTRVLVTRKLGRWASDSEAASVALEEYVDRHDPERKAARARSRRVDEGDPKPESVSTVSGEPHVDADPPCESDPCPGRYVRAAERRAVVSRNGMRCAVEGCDEVEKLQFAHRQHYRHSGPPLASNLDLLCLEHHRMVDSGKLKIRVARGRRILVDLSGLVVERFRVPHDTS